MVTRLQVRGLTVRYGSHTAVDAIDLDVGSDEVVAILGPSGCGKSSLLRAVAGLEPCEGTVRVDGEDVTRARPDQRRLGLMFQGDALFPHADVGGNVGFGLRMQGWSRDRVRDRVQQVLELVHLPDAAGRQVDTLSGGEQQRVALARAIAPDPRVLMLDEPLSSIDRALRDQLLEDLPTVFGRIGAAVLHVTHDQEEALAVADRVAVMREGRIVQVGPATAVWRHPATGFVARFLGQRNLLEVQVAGGSADTPFGRVPADDLPDGAATLWVPSDALRRVADDSPDGASVVPTVRTRRFAGDRVVLSTRTDEGLALEVTVPADDRVPSSGDAVALRVDTERLRVLPTA